MSEFTMGPEYYRVYEFTYEELRPLINILRKEPIPPEDHFPGIRAVLERLMEIGRENDTNRPRTKKTDD